MSLLPCSTGQAVAESRFKEMRQKSHLFLAEMMFKVQDQLNSSKERERVVIIKEVRLISR